MFDRHRPGVAHARFAERPPARRPRLSWLAPPSPPPPPPPEPEAFEPQAPLESSVLAVADSTRDDSEIADAIAGLVAARRELLARSEAEVLALAVAIARRVIARELALDPALIAHAAREGIRALESGPVTVTLGGLSEEALDQVRSRVEGRGVAVLADPRLPPGACLVETEHGAVDESFEARLAALLEEAP